jgi:RHS repeat-associated protein
VGSGPANNGNVRFQKLTVLGGAPVETVYRYDGLNRLKLANETPTSPSNPLCPDAGSHWCQQYGYDARGNRRVEAESNLGFVLGRPDSFGADNRITDAGFGYDGRGNLALLPTGERYVYDGENRQVVYCAGFVSEADCNNPAVTIGKTFYYYDGEGRRVGKVSGSVTEAYVYDARGQVAAEYGGPAVETATHYVTADHLGSTRVITDASKAVLQCKDYLPFGDEILATTQNARSGIGCYGGETGLRQKFTGHERDPESRLDYFGARYFSWAQGRFTSPDEWTGGIVDPFTGKQVSQPGPLPYADITDPQTINKYAYVRNNPLRYTDPDGHVIAPWDVLDLTLAAVSIKEAINEPTVVNIVGAILDVVGTAPYIPAVAGITIRAAKKLDNALDVERGLQAEKAVLKSEGLKRNTKAIEAIDPKTGEMGKTVPDSVRPSGATVEVKDRIRVSDSAQLRRQTEISKDSGRKAEVITGKRTEVSRTVRDRMRVRRRKDLGPEE